MNRCSAAPVTGTWTPNPVRCRLSPAGGRDPKEERHGSVRTRRKGSSRFSHLDNGLEPSQKVKMRTTIGPHDPLRGTCSKGIQSELELIHALPVFAAALFTMAKTQTRPQGPPIDEGTRTCNGILFSLKEERDLAMCTNADRPREHRLKSNKPDTERKNAMSHLPWDLEQKVTTWRQRVEGRDQEPV